MAGVTYQHRNEAGSRDPKAKLSGVNAPAEWCDELGVSDT